MTDQSSSQIQGFDWQKLMFSFEGRTRRQHFWIAWLILLGVNVVAGWIPLIGLLITIAAIWPSLAIQVKRLHDMGHSGWLAAIPFVANVIGVFWIIFSVGMSVFMNAEGLENEDPAAIMALLAPVMGGIALLFIVNIGFLLWIGLTPSQPGDNRFGPNPKAI